MSIAVRHGSSVGAVTCFGIAAIAAPAQPFMRRFILGGAPVFDETLSARPDHSLSTATRRFTSGAETVGLSGSGPGVARSKRRHATDLQIGLCVRLPGIGPGDTLLPEDGVDAVDKVGLLDMRVGEHVTCSWRKRRDRKRMAGARAGCVARGVRTME